VQSHGSRVKATLYRERIERPRWPTPAAAAHLLHVGEEALEQRPFVRLVEDVEGALKLGLGRVLKVLDHAAHHLGQWVERCSTVFVRANQDEMDTSLSNLLAPQP